MISFEICRKSGLSGKDYGSSLNRYEEPPVSYRMTKQHSIKYG